MYYFSTAKTEKSFDVCSDTQGEINSHMVSARTKTEEKQLTEGPISPKKETQFAFLLNLLNEPEKDFKQLYTNTH